MLIGESKNVADWLNSFDVFVLPSLSEGMSNTLLEAMAVGVAPIATAVGGNREVVQHEHSGLLVAARDAAQMSDFIVQLAAAPEWLKALGVRARERMVMQFSVERMVNRYDEMYSQADEFERGAVAVSGQRPKRLLCAGFAELLILRVRSFAAKPSKRWRTRFGTAVRTRRGIISSRPSDWDTAG